MLLASQAKLRKTPSVCVSVLCVCYVQNVVLYASAFYRSAQHLDLPNTNKMTKQISNLELGSRKRKLKFYETTSRASYIQYHESRKLEFIWRRYITEKNKTENRKRGPGKESKNEWRWFAWSNRVYTYKITLFRITFHGYNLFMFATVRNLVWYRAMVMS